MSEVLERRFAAIGARLKLDGPPLGAPTIDVGLGQFVIRFAGDGPSVDLEVVDVQPRDRHLLLLVRNSGEKSKFLCGHDERDWFVAAIPESARGVTGVETAKAALQPDLVRAAVARSRPKDRFRRRNSAYVRQGEWFFVPAPGLEPPTAFVRRDEPLSRGRGQVHVLELAYRRGGVVVWANSQHRAGISEAAYQRLTQNQRRGGGWMQFTRDPELYAMGAVRHPDHATVVLRGWHRVVMNTEQSARAMQHVAFLD